MLSMCYMLRQLFRFEIFYQIFQTTSPFIDQYLDQLLLDMTLLFLISDYILEIQEN